jgi:hypothetical protein
MHNLFVISFLCIHFVPYQLLFTTILFEHRLENVVTPESGKLRTNRALNIGSIHMTTIRICSIFSIPWHLAGYLALRVTYKR